MEQHRCELVTAKLQHITSYSHVIAGSPLVDKLAADFRSRIHRALRPRTLAAYELKFRLYIAFLVAIQQQKPDALKSVTLFLEYLAQQGLRAPTLTNYMTVLRHFLSIFHMKVDILENRLVKLAIRAVAYNAPLSFKIRGVLSVSQLRQLMLTLEDSRDKDVFRAIFLMGFFGFYRLSTLVPPARSGFSPSRFMTHGDVVWGPPGAHIITKCSKSMQVSGQSHIVQLPLLADKQICPVNALKRIVSNKAADQNKPLFLVSATGSSSILTAHRVRSVLRTSIKRLGLPPGEFGYHTFRRSGACWAFDNNVNFQHIKTHGGWRSDAIWRYLVKTPSAAGSVARTFQSLLN